MIGLSKDLHILEKFVDDLGDYLDGDTLFYPNGPRVPDLTLGGWFMRQHRLLYLRDMLTQDEQNRLQQLSTTAQTIFNNRIVRTEQKMHRELESRLRQWTEYLRDLREDGAAFSWYGTAVEARVMLAALLEQLQLPPYQLNSPIPKRLTGIDGLFQARWVHGDFVWDKTWQPAYPKADYWYLYGSTA